jgi:hypothetical protein
MTNLIYDWDFGVEGGLPALFIDGFIAVVIIYLACRNGKIKELGMNRVKTLEAHGLKMRVEEAAPVTPVNVEPVDSDSKTDIKEADPADTVVEEYTEE